MTGIPFLTKYQLNSLFLAVIDFINGNFNSTRTGAGIYWDSIAFLESPERNAIEFFFPSLEEAENNSYKEYVINHSPFCVYLK